MDEVPGMVADTMALLWRERQADFFEFQDSQDDMVRPCVRRQTRGGFTVYLESLPHNTNGRGDKEQSQEEGS